MVRGGHRGRGRGGYMKPRPPFIPHVPFDIVLAEPAFPSVKPPEGKADLSFPDALVKRNEDLTPSHWQDINNLIEGEINLEDPEFTLKALIELDVV